MALPPYRQLVVVDEREGESPAEPIRPPFQLRESVGPLITSNEELSRVSDILSAGSGPLALDAERASGFTYSQRAYLIQVRREGAGTGLIDPLGITDFAPLADVARETEWILHAATQDLECLREIGLVPQRLFDTELAGRLLGRERVGLAGLIESELGEVLTKGHGAANWSMRPLTPEMITYAALDVELLIELRNSLEISLREDDKWHIAEQEFAYLVGWQPKAQSPEAWRRTSGVHAIRSPRSRARVRELWISRDDLARRRDTAPGRFIPDRAIVAAAKNNPSSIEELFSIKEFNGRGAKRYERVWWDAIQRARSLPESELPGPPPRSDAPPPPRAWAEKNPAAYARLEFIRSQTAAISEKLSIPVENLMVPDLVRRIAWDEPETSEIGLRERLANAGARPWQIDLVAPVLWESRNVTPAEE